MGTTQAAASRTAYNAELDAIDAASPAGQRTEPYLRVIARLLADILYRHESVRPEDAPQS